MYDHHWIALSNYHHNQICGVEYVFGIGAESRNNVQKLPAGHGYVVDKADTQWSANIHRTQRESNWHSSNPHRRAPPTRGSED